MILRAKDELIALAGFLFSGESTNTVAPSSERSCRLLDVLFGVAVVDSEGKKLHDLPSKILVWLSNVILLVI